MNDLYSFVEDWCRKYKPIQHTPGPEGRNHRFFLTTGFMGLADFMRGSDIDRSPSIIMETNVEGELSDWDSTSYTIYCAVRADDQSNGRAAKDAIREGKRHLQKLIAYMREQKRKYHNPILDGLNPDDTLHYQSEGPIYDGWYTVYLTIDQVLKYNQCVDSNDYVDVADDPFFVIHNS